MGRASQVSAMSEPLRAPEACVSMQEVRAGIDALDRDLVALLARRQRFIEAAARVKQSKAAVRDEARIADVLAKVTAAAEAASLSPEIARAVWTTLIEASIAHEHRVFDALRS